ncbi:MAG: hypothetical protein SFU55_08630 [Methylophilus sp.]|nr:hypothetical protein [Methylophilus sp.]
MDKESAELVKFPVKLRRSLSKVNPSRKAPEYKTMDGFTFPQRLWEVYLDLSEVRNEPYEVVSLEFPRHQLMMLAWLALSNKNRKAGKPPLTDKEWFQLEDDYVMLIAKQAMMNLVNMQLETELLALKKGEHSVLSPLPD